MFVTSWENFGFGLFTSLIKIICSFSQFSDVVGTKTYPPANHIPALNFDALEFKNIAPEKLCFFRGIPPNGLYFVLKPQVWTYTRNKVTAI